MKRIFTILFTLLYLILSVGVNVLVHTCGGESETMVATTTVEDPCGCADGMTSDEMCCTTVISTMQLDDAQKTTVADATQVFFTGEYLDVVSPSFSGTALSSIPVAIETPPPPNNDLNILHSVFLI